MLTDCISSVFIHRSIKTRIETISGQHLQDNASMFLYIDPLKQGLKQSDNRGVCYRFPVFIHRSIKTRIETAMIFIKFTITTKVFIHRSIKTRIETEN